MRYIGYEVAYTNSLIKSDITKALKTIFLDGNQ